MSAAQAAVRTAGRGAALRPTRQHRDRSLTRLPPHPARRTDDPPPPTASRGRGMPRATHQTNLRSALATSVLKAEMQPSRNARRTRQSPQQSSSRHGSFGGARVPAPRRPAIVDWYSSTERAEALERFVVRGSGAVEQVETADKPFAWADFERVLEQLPEGHWANGYVASVARSLEGNCRIAGVEKEKILNETLATLAAISGGGGREGLSVGERFQDA